MLVMQDQNALNRKDRTMSQIETSAPIRTVTARPLTAEAFAPWGQVIDAAGTPDRLINEGRCGRFHDRARIDTAGKTGISVFSSEPVSLPLRLTLVERHPLGSQAFLPMTEHPFLVIVAPDEDGTPGTPQAFITAPGQGINIDRNVWHGTLTPLARPGLFAVVDHCDTGANLEEFTFDEPWTVQG